MTITEVCEPLFLYISRLNRAARKGGAVEYREVRGQIDAIFDQMRAKAATDPALQSDFEKIELALLFFVDSMIAESRLSFAGEWHANRLAYAIHEQAGDEKFFDILDEVLADTSSRAVGRIAVLYTCLGLGFMGWYAGQPEHIHNKMLECSARMRELMDKDDAARICPEAYEHADARNLIEPPGAKILGILIAFIGLLVVVWGANLVAYKAATKDLESALNAINEPTLNQAEGVSP